VLGSILMRTQGRKAWRRFNQAVGAGRVPTTEAIDGVLVIFGGALLLAPGFVTDVFGAALLLPLTRPLVRGLVVRRFAARMIASATRRPRGGTGGRTWDVDGTAHEVDPRPRLQ
jgi:UPF0716 protein FxsA